VTQAQAPVPSYARRRAVAALHGALLGAWWGLVFLLLVRATDRGWWLLPYERVQLDRVFGYEHLMLPVIAHKLGFEFPGLDMLVLLLIATGALVGFLCSIIGQWLRIDPEMESRRALVDVARSTKFLALFLGLPLALAFAASAWSKGFWIACFLFGMLSPFLVSNRGWLAWIKVASVPRLRWPGWRVVLGAVVFTLACILFDAIVEGLGKLLGPLGSFLAFVLTLPLDAAMVLFAGAIWIDRFPRLQSVWAQRGRLLAWKPVAAFLALQVRMTVPFAWLFPVLIGAGLLSVFVLPQLEELLREQGRSMPGYLYATSRLTREWFWWLLVALPALGAVYGRLYIRLFPRSLNEPVRA
jgi:hypothetical protein